MRLSGLQKEVLALYRQCLRESRKKPTPTRPHFESFIRDEFRKNAQVDRRDFAAVEFLLRKGRRQLEVYSAPGIKDKGGSHRFPKFGLGHRQEIKGIQHQDLPHRVLPLTACTSVSAAAAEEVFRHPLSDSVEKLRRDQRNIIRKRRCSRIRRVSFSWTSASGASSLQGGKRKNKARSARPSSPKKPTAKTKARGLLNACLGDVAKQLRTNSKADAGPYPHFDRRLIGRPQLQQAPYDGGASASGSKSAVWPGYPVAQLGAGYPNWDNVPLPPPPRPPSSKYRPDSLARARYRKTQYGPNPPPVPPGVPVPPNMPHVRADQPRNTIPRRPVGASYRSRPPDRTIIGEQQQQQQPPPQQQLQQPQQPHQQHEQQPHQQFQQQPEQPQQPQHLRQQRRRLASPLPQNPIVTVAQHKASRRAKHLGVADPAVWESVARTLSQQHQLSSLVSPQQAPVRLAALSEAPSRSSSQQKALERFTKDLRNYADDTRAYGRVPVFPSTTTESGATLATVDELLPYHKQFRAAGLAVTSTEQREKTPVKSRPLPRTRHESAVSSLPPASSALQDERIQPKESIVQRRGSRDSTVIHFTQPGEPSYLLVDELPAAKHRNASPKKARSKRRKEPHPGPPVAKPSLAHAVEHEILPRRLPLPPSPSQPPPPIPEAARREIHKSVKTQPSRRQPPRPPEPPGVEFSPIRYGEEPPGATAPPRTPIRQETSRGDISPRGTRTAADASPSRRVHPGRRGDSTAQLPDERRTSTASRVSRAPKPRGLRPPGGTARDAEERVAEERPHQPARQPELHSRDDGRREKPHATRPAKQQQHQYPPQTPPRSRRLTIDGFDKMLPSPPPLPPAPPPTANRARRRCTGSSPPPELPVTWKYAAGSSSSFEKALDAVAHKLDSLEEASRDREEAQGRAATGAEHCGSAKQQRPCKELRPLPGFGDDPYAKPTNSALPPSSGLPPSSPVGAEKQTKKEVSSSPSSAHPARAAAPVDRLDRDIRDRDVLRGLRLATGAACDSELDAWIRARTGLRLRRFLADLVAFEGLAEEREREKEARRAAEVESARGRRALATVDCNGGGDGGGCTEGLAKRDKGKEKGREGGDRNKENEREDNSRNNKVGGC